MTGKFFSLSFPVPLFIFWDLIECLIDIVTVICLFVPKKEQEDRTYYGIHTVKEILEMLVQLFYSMQEKEPYDFVNITVDKFKISLKIH